MQNLKVAITGHTKGIGQGFANYFKDQDVHGFSRSNGWDLTRKETCDALIHNLNDFDLFINNACIGDKQLYLFDNIFKLWFNKNKTIINVGCIDGSMTEKDLEGLESFLFKKLNTNKHSVFKNVDTYKIYNKNKRDLNQVANSANLKSNLKYKGYPYVLNLNAGAVDTHSSYHGTSSLMKHYLTVEEFIKVFDNIWQMKDYCRVTNITFLGNNDVRKLYE